MIFTILDNIGFIILLVGFFGISIFIHELGHYLVARWCGLVVEVFSIGFGPAIWQKKVNGIVYKICWIPVGGYVALPQLDPTGMSHIQGQNESDKSESAAPLPRIAGWKKVLVSVAGAVGNVLLAFVLAFIIAKSPKAITYEGTTTIGYVAEDSVAYAQGIRAGDSISAVNGKPVQTWYDLSTECLLASHEMEVRLTVNSPTEERDVVVPLEVDAGLGIPVLAAIEGEGDPCLIAKVKPDGAADRAGLVAGDIVLSFDGQPVRDVPEFQRLVSERPDQTVSIAVRRKGVVETLTVTPVLDPALNRPMIGVELASTVMPWMRFKHPWKQVKSDALVIGRVLKALITPKESGKAAQGLGGPVAISVLLWASVKVSILSGIGFMRFLNINLALLNLLPLPVLDGGHIVFAFAEMIRRKPLNARFVNALVNVFAVFLIGAIIILSIRDIDRFTPVGRYVRGLFGQEPAAIESFEPPPAASTSAPAAP